jgi:hypothetical protein
MQRKTKRAPAIAVLAERRQLDCRAFLDVCAALEGAGCRLPLLVSGPGALHSLSASEARWDGALVWARDALALAAAGAAEAAGTPVANAPAAVALARDPVSAHCALRRHGLPVGPSWIATGPEGISRAPAEAFPLRVRQAGGVAPVSPRVLSTPAEAGLLPALHDRRSLYIAEPVEDEGAEHAVFFGVGKQVFAGTRTEGANGSGRRSGPGAEAALRDLALACGRALGLDFWRVELAIGRRGPRVLDVSESPTFAGVPEAAPAIARHLLRRAGVDESVRPRAMRLMQGEGV